MEDELLKNVEKDIQKLRPPTALAAGSDDGRFGGWKLEQLLGRNSLGELYLATKKDHGSANRIDSANANDAANGKQSTGSVAALRSLDSSLSRNSRLVKRFLQEAEKASTVVHPNIARVFDFGGADSGRPFIAREYIDGQTLQSMMKDGPLECGRVIEIALAVCAALGGAAKHELLHGNLVPANIIIDKQGQVHVVDFGITKTAPNDQRETLGLTTYDGRQDDLRYLSPELARDEGRNANADFKVNCKSDLYSLGCILHFLFTGHELFADRTGFRLLQAKAHGQIDKNLFESIKFDGSPEQRQKMVESVTILVRRSISGDPRWRYESSEELSDDLKRLNKGENLLPTTYSAVKEIDRSIGGRSSDDNTVVAQAAATVKKIGGIRADLLLIFAAVILLLFGWFCVKQHLF